MAARKIQSLKFEAHIVDRLHKCRITTCRDVLMRTTADLMNDTNLLPHIVTRVIERCSAVCAPTPVTALSLLLDETNNDKLTVLPTSLDGLDQLLCGGLLSGSITEITGPPGCGKTQFSLMMTVMLLTLHPSSSVIYIDTEAAFFPKRLLEIAVCRFPDIYSTEESLEELTRRVILFTELTCNNLLKRVENLEIDIITHNVGLVILDSVASPVRKEFDCGVKRNVAARSDWLMRLAALLKYTASTFCLLILITNQIAVRSSGSFTTVTACRVEDDDDADCVVNQEVMGDKTSCEVSGEWSSVSTSSLAAALGNSWSHCVNTRLILQYLDESGNTRQLLIAKSPVAPFTRFIYTVALSAPIDVCKFNESCEYYSGTDPNQQRISTRTFQ